MITWKYNLVFNLYSHNVLEAYFALFRLFIAYTATHVTSDIPLVTIETIKNEFINTSSVAGLESASTVGTEKDSCQKK